MYHESEIFKAFYQYVKSRLGDWVPVLLYNWHFLWFFVWDNIFDDLTIMVDLFILYLRVMRNQIRFQNQKSYRIVEFRVSTEPGSQAKFKPSVISRLLYKPYSWTYLRITYILTKKVQTNIQWHNLWMIKYLTF